MIEDTDLADLFGIELDSKAEKKSEIEVKGGAQTKMKDKHYANGQKVHELIDGKLTYYFNNGKVKAEGPYENELMQGEWKFYRVTGQLWQVGNFESGKKNGIWIRYDKNNQLEYNKEFVNDKLLIKIKEK